jgi:23S rRNA (adenine1618-N6)-methyltransferase
MHPRNKHRGHYNFSELLGESPCLAGFMKKNPSGESTIDFANPEAVRTLNQALLKRYYGTTGWDVPKGYLCPPVPGRADYIHAMADVLAADSDSGEEIPRGEGVRVLDVGVGANAIYPIIGRSEYGWKFVGSDIDSVALAAAEKIIQANESLRNGVELRLQPNRAQVLKGVISKDEKFDLVISNPPFHASLEDARAGTERKWKNLGRAPGKGAPVLNFGGQGSELWCEGGEVRFIRTMIDESRAFAKNVRVFSSLVSRETSLPAIEQAIRQAMVSESTTVEMTQGQKKTRVLVWSFLPKAERAHFKS